MGLKNVACALVMAFLAMGCTSDNYLVAQNEKIVEVPVYIESEVPEDPGLIWIDSFIQPQSIDGVDILWVIDTSGSMNSYDPALLSGIEAMLMALPPSGWRLAMMSNDPTKASVESQFPLVPGDDAADALAMYSAMGRGSREEGFDAAYEYIINNPYAATWMRPDAALLIVFVSDEEEQSDAHFPVVADFITWYGSMRNGSVFISSIVNLPDADSACPGQSPASDVGDRYIEATDHFSGVVVDICTTDWSAGVNDASVQIEPYEEIALTHQPIEESIRVFVDGSLYNEWYYLPQTNTVYFTVTPDGNSLVEVGYRYYDTGSDTGDTGN